MKNMMGEMVLRNRLQDRVELECGRPTHRDRTRCNICGKNYRRKSKHDRYCVNCREESELFRFAEWLAV